MAAMLPTPIFIICFNRLGVLRTSIASYRRLARPVQLVIHDNGSSYPPLLAYFAELEAEGVEVVRSGRKATQQEDLNSVNDTVQAYFADKPAAPYVVTDPDIELDPAGSDLLDLYEAMLAAEPEAEAVGPMLRIDDIPDSYPLKDEVLSRHERKFWKRQPSQFAWQGGVVNYIRSPVDTTFALHRAGLPFQRMRNALRTHPPYWARHLDWYLDPDAMAEDQAYYLETAMGISYWGGPMLKRTIERQRREREA